MKQLTTAASVVALLLMMSFNVTGEGSILLPQGRRAQKIDYSQFSHRTHVEKQKLACDSCHKFPTTNWKDVRPGDAAFPDVAEFPEHTSCLSCHRRQFFARQRPAPAICSNCHVNVTPRDTARFMFPSLGDVANCSQRKRNVAAEFVVEFPHDKHEDQECVACHQLDKEGEVKTKPNNHSVCFSCHNVESELPPAPSTCNACHKSIKVSQANHVPTRYREVVLTVSNSAPWDDGARLGQGQYHHAVLLTVSNLDSAIGNSQYHHAVLLTASNLDSAIGNSQYHHAVAGGSEQRMKVRDDADFSKFQHTSEYHQRMPCLLCHRRESNAAEPNIPGGKDHLPCAGCHVKQFADRSNAICTNCHIDPSKGSLKPFPKLSSFNVTFDHARHNGITCTNCHRPARSGVALTIPIGFNAHTTCFQCHGPHAKSGDRDISSCGVCHQLGPHVRTTQTARAFRLGFSHSQHNRDERLSCIDCHRVRAGVQKNEVTAPQPLNHHAAAGAFSCMSCHNGKRAFGGDDFTVCTRCHKGSVWQFK